MRAIDSQHEITHRNMILREKFQNFSIFSSIYTSISLNQGQVSIFTLRGCSQSIFRLEITLKSRYLKKKIGKNFLKKTTWVAPFPRCRRALSILYRVAQMNDAPS